MWVLKKSPIILCFYHSINRDCSCTLIAMRKDPREFFENFLQLMRFGPYLHQILYKTMFAANHPTLAPLQ